MGVRWSLNWALLERLKGSVCSVTEHSGLEQCSYTLTQKENRQYGFQEGGYKNVGLREKRGFFFDTLGVLRVDTTRYFVTW